MSLKNVLRKLADDLEVWSEVGINEAQTSQVIILPILQALGYDIFNPLEVVAQSSSYGSIPDYTVELEGTIRFIIEVKGLNKAFSDNDQAQAVNYVNTQGRRWAILTNGRAWHFFDNQIAKPAAEKLALTIDLQNKRAASYLAKLLAREFWVAGDADSTLAAIVNEVHDDIRKRIKLGEIEEKLELELKEGFTQDEKGLEKAIQLTLEPNEKELASEAFSELADRLLGSTNDTASGKAKNSDNELVAAIRKGILDVFASKTKKTSSAIKAALGEDEIEVSSWRGITAGIVEALLILNQTKILDASNLVFGSIHEKIKKKSGEPYKPYDYRHLGDGRYLFLHGSAKEQVRRSRKFLKLLGAPAGLPKITHDSEDVYLP